MYSCLLHLNYEGEHNVEELHRFQKISNFSISSNFSDGGTLFVINFFKDMLDLDIETIFVAQMSRD